MAGGAPSIRAMIEDDRAFAAYHNQPSAPGLLNLVGTIFCWLLFENQLRPRNSATGCPQYATAFRACRYRIAHQAFGAVMKVTPEVVERIRRLGRRVTDIAQLRGLSEATVKKVLRGATTKKCATETQETGTEIDRED
jgi:hypothetical protein